MDETPTTLTVKDFLRVRSEVADRLKRVNTRSQTDFTKHAERLMELGYIDTAAVLSVFPVAAEPLPLTAAPVSAVEEARAEVAAEIVKWLYSARYHYAAIALETNFTVGGKA